MSTTMLAVRIPTDLHDQLTAEAAQLGVTRTEVVRARLAHPEVERVAEVQAAEQLRSVLALIGEGDVTGSPMARHYLAGAADALAATPDAAQTTE